MANNDQPPEGTKTLLNYFSAAAKTKTKSNASETSPNGVEIAAAKSPQPSTSNKQVPDTECINGPSNKSISVKPNSFVPSQKSNAPSDAAAACSLERGMAAMGKTETGTSKLMDTSTDNNKKRKSEMLDDNLKDGKSQAEKTAGKPTSTSSTSKPKKVKNKSSSTTAVSGSKLASGGKIKSSGEPKSTTTAVSSSKPVSSGKPKKDKKKKSVSTSTSSTSKPKKDKKKKSKKGKPAEDEPTSPSQMEKARDYRDKSYAKKISNIATQASAGKLGMNVGRKRLQLAREEARNTKEQKPLFSAMAEREFKLDPGTVSPVKNPLADAEIEKIAHLSSQPDRSDSSSSDSSSSGSESEEENESE